MKIMYQWLFRDSQGKYDITAAHYATKEDVLKIYSSVRVEVIEPIKATAIKDGEPGYEINCENNSIRKSSSPYAQYESFEEAKASLVTGLKKDLEMAEENVAYYEMCLEQWREKFATTQRRLVEAKDLTEV